LELSELSWDRIRTGTERGEAKAAALLTRPSWVQKWARVLRMARKPTMPEFMAVCRTAFIGMIIIGGIGVIVFSIFLYAPPYLSDVLGL